MSATAEWWHVFGGPSDKWGGCIALSILGPGIPPDEIDEETKREGYAGLAYITSVDHKPSEAEKDAWTAAITAAAPTTEAMRGETT